jgi:hypothetical protein
MPALVAGIHVTVQKSCEVAARRDNTSQNSAGTVATGMTPT